MKPVIHESPRAGQKLAFMRHGEVLHELCLKRSDNRPEININSELLAHAAAAKLCGTRRLHISDVWTEDGECPDNGKYRIWYLITTPLVN
jgi:hypothetical protein